MLFTNSHMFNVVIGGLGMFSMLFSGLVGTLLANETITSMHVFPSSFSDDNSAHFAVDNSSSTCFISGREPKATLKFDFGEQITLSRVSITGLSPGLYSVYIGDKHTPYGDLSYVEFDDKMCTRFSVHESNSTIAEHMTLQCVRPMQGRYVALQDSEEMKANATRMVVCDIKFWTSVN